MTLRRRVEALIAAGAFIAAGCESSDPLTGDPLAAPGTIRVTIVVGDGTAIGTDTTVRLTGPVERTITTKVGATPAFTDLPPGSYTVSATINRFIDCPSLSVGLEAGGSTDAELICARRVGTISGRVSGGGNPLSATVTLTGGGSRQSRTTDSDGSFSFVAVAGENVLQTVSDNYICPLQTVHVEMGMTTMADVSCVPKAQGSIDGRVVSGDLDLPFVLVTLTGPVSSSAIADGRGSFSFRDVNPGRYTLTATRPGSDCPPVRVDVQAAQTITLLIHCELRPPIGSEIEGSWEYVRLLRSQTGSCPQGLSGEADGSMIYDFSIDTITILGLDPAVTITGAYDEGSGLYSGGGVAELGDGSSIETRVAVQFGFFSLGEPWTNFSTDQRPSDVMRRWHRDPDGRLVCTEIYGAGGLRQEPIFDDSGAGWWDY